MRRSTFSASYSSTINVQEVSYLNTSELKGALSATTVPECVSKLNLIGWVRVN